MTPRRIAVIFAAAGLALVAPGCGDDADDAASGKVGAGEACAKQVGEPGGAKAIQTPIPELASPGEKLAKVKAAWLYVGPTNDGGWTTAHDNGRKAAEKALGDKLETTYKENVPEGPEAAQAIEDLIKDGNNIIFATSFGFGEAMKAAAKKHPDVKFEHATGSDTADNLSIYFGAGEDSLYLSGMAAGAATKSGKIGFVAPFPIPEVIRHINAYALGAQSVNPDATVKVTWINSWFAPDEERKAAEALIAGGADVIASGGDSPAPGEAAKAANVPWTGYDSDQSANFPDIWLTATTYDWGPYYTKRVQQLLDGTWGSGSYYGGLEDGFTDLAPFGKLVEETTKSDIEAKRQEIIDGTSYPFTGPILDQSGCVKIADGDQTTAGDILSMDWFVKGVEGKPTG